MSRGLCAITADSCGWHDPLCGLTDQADIEARYGRPSYQVQRNERDIVGREGMLVEMGKYGLGERDLDADINFFSKVTVDAAGALALHAGVCRAGDAVNLRFEMDCIVILHAGPHPLAQGSEYAPPGVTLEAWRSPPPGADDPCRMRCAENQRGYLNTERYVAA